MDKNQKVHSEMNSNGNKSWLFFSLPLNSETPLKTKKVISWAYWVGVGEEGNQAWQQNIKTVGKLAKGVASIFLTPLGALAVGAIADLAIPTSGEDVGYWIVMKKTRIYLWQIPNINVGIRERVLPDTKSF
ncbi:MAG TPA: hypothetical protein VD905_20020 [Flavobacteriales bacterium]|nr:hypothetical protein [Flavobacteriales bacterium]